MESEMKRNLTFFLAATAWLIAGGVAHSQLYSDAGAAPADIQDVVDAFRADLGNLNPNVIGSLGSGRREINWDAVPDQFAAPNQLPANFFNSNSPRGAEFETPGTGFQVSANAANQTGTPIEFGNIDPSYPGSFETFSPEKLFTALGSTITDVNFFVPGTSTPALTTGFGAVFTDVDDSTSTSIEFFGINGASLRKDFVPALAGDETLSFLGFDFEAPIISSVRITSGNQVLALGNLTEDLVVMDDFIYGEPVAAAVAVPEPGSLALVGSGLLALFWLRRRQHQGVTRD
jgi:hypothetical protein